VAADFSGVTLADAGPDRVLVRGGAGRARPDRLKASMGYRDGFIGEGQISYAGPDAVARGRLALEIVARRLELTGLAAEDLRCELIGLDAILGPRAHATGGHPSEVRARVAARTSTLRDAMRVGNEVEALYTNGPAAGGGVTKSAREVIAMCSTLVPRDLARPTVHCEVT
jgi:hypothetical protein